ncbi:metal-sulfur cluster assembly factor [Allosalinactinospora lopnorensis]|uniref:metal-sulfur cluster assembly factor n=1 Tax=Allosalinactinospora lopnorensis TaxID=1352348 RepID=UPI000623F2E4|nr:iron-sulfur cluster assembly protein [Allosalinactinospora lopnorensis]
MTRTRPRPAVPVSAVWRALGTVRDPELDEPITDLGFVADAGVADDGTATADLRLPTYFCAPNFAFLMVADADDALRALPGVSDVRVRLLDHFASEEINGGVAAGRGFGAAFPDLAEGELAELRLAFRRKAHAACQERVATALLASGADHAELLRLRLGDAAGRVDGGELERLRRRRRDLALPAREEAPLLVDDEGAPLTLEELPARLRFARTTRISIEGNAGWCRGLLRTRYGAAEDARETAG